MDSFFIGEVFSKSVHTEQPYKGDFSVEQDGEQSRGEELLRDGGNRHAVRGAAHVRHDDDVGLEAVAEEPQSKSLALSDGPLCLLSE